MDELVHSYRRKGGINSGFLFQNKIPFCCYQDALCEQAPLNYLKAWVLQKVPPHTHKQEGILLQTAFRLYLHDHISRMSTWKPTLQIWAHLLPYWCEPLPYSKCFHTYTHTHTHTHTDTHTHTHTHTHRLWWKRWIMRGRPWISKCICNLRRKFLWDEWSES
jgi:hypothetical protein